MNYWPPGSSVRGIFQARMLRWDAIFFSRDLPDPGIQSVFSCLSPSPRKTHFGLLLPVALEITKRLTLGTLIYCREAAINFSFPCVSDGKESAWNAGDADSIPGLGGSPGEGNDNPLQYSCLENPMDRGLWRAKFMESQRVGHDWVTNTFTSGRL